MLGLESKRLGEVTGRIGVIRHWKIMDLIVICKWPLCVLETEEKLLRYKLGHLHSIVAKIEIYIFVFGQGNEFSWMGMKPHHRMFDMNRSDSLS